MSKFLWNAAAQEYYELDKLEFQFETKRMGQVGLNLEDLDVVESLTEDMKAQLFIASILQDDNNDTDAFD
ncbi:hypothetical protein A3D88_04215 [Candidatus Peribacteria bacterium RIFCSPHIGHO2_02_FULL_52_16]|nr:MAG: hypothetical protein A2706_00960 [Candidatus Peribacteria bacterium RIFCSPHIGHO2_01_FULL_51_35]OGJ60819.1 MAG: hypothetical protein A3D88_04215 [Candidatus Peribacteria bacterium RIFCSPHIGHO2_02_FULL_52_16]